MGNWQTFPPPNHRFVNVSMYSMVYSHAKELLAVEMEGKNGFLLEREGLVFLCQSQHECLQEFAKHFFHPYFRELRGDGGALQIRILVRKKSPSSIVSDHQIKWEAFCIVRNNRDERKNVAAKRASLQGVELVWLEKNNCLIVIDPGLRTASIVCEDPAAAEHAFHLFVRDVTNSYLLSNHFCEVHASATATDEHGCSIYIGDKNRGKTSFLFNALSKGEDFVSNGRVFLRLDAGGARVLGTPEYVYVRPFSLVKWAEFFRDWPEYEGVEKLAHREEDSFKLKVFYKRIVETFSARISAGGELSRIGFPLLGVEPSSDTGPLRTIVLRNIAGFQGIERRFWHKLFQADPVEYESNRMRIVEYVNSFPNTEALFHLQ